MNKQNDINKIIEILKKGALKFRDDFDESLKHEFVEERKEDEIIVHFKIFYNRELEYLIGFKKQKIEVDNIPNVKGYTRLDLSLNPFRNLKFTDENSILGNIYDYIKEIDIDEIVCYQKFGIILRNPLELNGIYNINIKYITD